MIFYSENQVKEMAIYYIENRTTFRKVGNVFGIPFTTISYLFNKNLKEIDYNLYIKVKELIDVNTKTKHHSGGMASRYKYAKQRNELEAKLYQDAIMFCNQYLKSEDNLEDIMAKYNISYNLANKYIYDVVKIHNIKLYREVLTKIKAED